MSDRDRSEFVALVAVACTVVVFLIGLAAGLGYPSGEQEARTSYQQVETNSRDNVSEAVASQDDFDFWRDPFPQWAMAGFAAFATGASFWAIFEVRKTFRETRRANEILESDRRPWLAIKSLNRPETVTCTKEGARFFVSISVENFGDTPAVEVAYLLDFAYLQPGSFDPSAVLGSFASKPGFAFGEQTIFPKQADHSLDTAIEIDPSRIRKVPDSMTTVARGSIFLIAGVSYRSAGMMKRYTTLKAYSVSLPSADHWQIGECPLLLHEGGHFVPDLVT